MNIEDMFAEYNEKKRKESDEVAVQEKQNADSRVAAIEFLKTNVIPVFQEVAEKIRQQGHTAAVSEMIENFTSPSVTLELRLASAKGIQVLHTSTLRVMHKEAGVLQVSPTIKGPNSGSVARSPQLTPRYEVVTKSWLEKQAIEFIRQVLALH